jgi:hypothetical protein
MSAKPRRPARFHVGPVTYSRSEFALGAHRFDAHDEWGNNVGFAAPQEDRNHGRIETIYVVPGARGNRIASLLLDNIRGHFPRREWCADCGHRLDSAAHAREHKRMQQEAVLPARDPSQQNDPERPHGFLPARGRPRSGPALLGDKLGPEIGC